MERPSRGIIILRFIAKAARAPPLSAVAGARRAPAARDRFLMGVHPKMEACRISNPDITFI